MLAETQFKAHHHHPIFLGSCFLMWQNIILQTVFVHNNDNLFETKTKLELNSETPIPYVCLSRLVIQHWANAGCMETLNFTDIVWKLTEV